MKIKLEVTLENEAGPTRNCDQVSDALADELDGTCISVSNESGTGDRGEYVVTDVQVVYGEKSIVEALESEMDRVASKIMIAGVDGPDYKDFEDSMYQDLPQDRVEYRDAVKTWGEQRGQLQGLVFAVAVLKSLS